MSVIRRTDGVCLKIWRSICNGNKKSNVNPLYRINGERMLLCKYLPTDSALQYSNLAAPPRFGVAFRIRIRSSNRSKPSDFVELTA
jgi:hypothetical protein